jgi:hypothetical protein
MQTHHAARLDSSRNLSTERRHTIEMFTHFIMFFYLFLVRHRFSVQLNPTESDVFCVIISKRQKQKREKDTVKKKCI